MQICRVTKWTDFVGVGIFDILSVPGQSGLDTLPSAFPPNYLHDGNNSADNHQTLKGLRAKSLAENLTMEDLHHVGGAWVCVSFYISYTRCQQCQEPDLRRWWLTLTSQGVQFPKQCQWSSRGLTGCGSVHTHQTGVNLQSSTLRTAAAQATAVAVGPLSRGTVGGYVPHQGQRQASPCSDITADGGDTCRDRMGDLPGPKEWHWRGKYCKNFEEFPIVTGTKPITLYLHLKLLRQCLPNLFQEPSVRRNTVTIWSFQAIDRGLFSHTFGFVFRTCFSDKELLILESSNLDRLRIFQDQTLAPFCWTVFPDFSFLHFQKQ